jgi:biotin carboxyl carrier protein
MSATKLEIGVAGRTHAVTIAPGDAPGRYRITIDGEAPRMVDAVAIVANGATTWSVRDVETGMVRSIAIALGPSGEGEAVVGSHVVPVALAGRRGRRRGALEAGEGEQRLVAPMPGKVIRVLVKAGDTVAARQALVVIEAMKMENEIAAPRAGTVGEVSVGEGDPVEAGRLLVVVASSLPAD